MGVLAANEQHGLGQQPVLDGVNAGEQARLIVARQDGDRLLQQDRAAVEVLVDDVDGHAGRPDPGGQRITHGVSARKSGQQRRMDVEHAAAKCRQRLRADDPHEARQHHHVRFGRCQRFCQPPVKCRWLNVLDQNSCQAVPVRPIEGRAWTVGHDKDYLDRQPAGTRGFGERAQIGTRPADADGGLQGRRSST